MDRTLRFLYKERTLLDAVMVTATTNLMSIMMLIGTFAIAAIPAMLSGIAAYHYVYDVWGYAFAVPLAIATGLGLESVGIVATFSALKLYTSWRNGKTDVYKFLLALWLVLFYAVATGAVVFVLDNMPMPMIGLGVVAPWLAITLYTARGLYQEISDQEAQEKIKSEQFRQDAVVERDAGIDAKALAASRRHELKMQELQFRHQQPLPEITGKLPEEKRKLPEWLPHFPENLTDWRQMLAEGMEVPAYINGSTLAGIAGNITERTARNWLGET